jgi:polar amino acid transport system substrate-binding protein
MARLAILSLAAALSFAAAQAGAGEPAPKPFIPNLFDPAGQAVKPEALLVKSIRFLTSDDFPPFHFALPDGTLAGFDIDLARAICADLKVACTIQARRFDTLTKALGAGQGDAVIAALANTAASRAEFDFTAPYYTTPARFVTRITPPVSDVTPEALSGHTIGVQAGTTHLAFLKAFYPASVITPYPDQETLRAALRDGKAEAIFGDGIALSLWLNGTGSQGCCAFQGGPFTESHFFGNGVSIAVAKNNTGLRATLDYELEKLSQDGVFADLYLKYFPTGFY